MPPAYRNSTSSGNRPEQHENNQKYGVKRIITGLSACFNVFKQEYPQLGGVMRWITTRNFINELLSNAGDTSRNNSTRSYLSRSLYLAVQ
jgi:Fe-S oxidoreductase